MLFCSKTITSSVIQILTCLVLYYTGVHEIVLSVTGLMVIVEIVATVDITIDVFVGLDGDGNNSTAGTDNS